MGSAEPGEMVGAPLVGARNPAREGGHKGRLYGFRNRTACCAMR